MKTLKNDMVQERKELDKEETCVNLHVNEKYFKDGKEKESFRDSFNRLMALGKKYLN